MSVSCSYHVIRSSLLWVAAEHITVNQLNPLYLEARTHEPGLPHSPAVKRALQRRPPPLHSPGPRQQHVAPHHTEDDEILKQKKETDCYIQGGNDNLLIINTVATSLGLYMYIAG